MKTTLLTAMLLATGTMLSAVETSAPCGAPATPLPPACCVPEKPAQAAAKIPAQLSAKSLHQLDAQWTTDAERSVTLSSFRGRPVVLAMFFAQCEYACPVIVNDIRRLLALLPEAKRAEAQVVLVTFDTVRDTPAALRTFRERMKIDASWSLLRSDSDAVQELAMLLGVKFKQDARGQFAHSNIITVLNPEGEIVHQLAGLNGDVSETAKVLARLSPEPAGI